MTCFTCQYFLQSEKAGQRAYLEGFGYCNATPDIALRARFVRDDSACWLPEPRYKERRS